MITIRGVCYKTIKEAATALSVKPATIYTAREQDRLETVGLGVRVKTVKIRGVEYESAKVAADKLGVTINRIYNARKEGTLDAVGLGRQEMPVTIRGQKFKSAKAAAEFFGIKVNNIYNALDRGTINNVGLGPGRHNSPRNGNSKPLDFGRIRFASHAEASRYIGRSDKYVETMLKRGKRETVIGQIFARYEKDRAE